MLKKLVATDDSIAPTILRVLLGGVFFAHGAQKLLGWFGGYGYSATMQYFTHGGIPAPLAFLVIFTEFFGALALILGVGTRLAALGVAVIMVVAVATTHIANGFFMNWSGQQHGEGFEYHILAVAVSVALMIWGAGRYSIDRRVAAAL